MLVIVHRSMCLNWKGAEVSWLVEQVIYRQIASVGLWAVLTFTLSLLNSVAVKKNSLPLVKCGYQAPQKSPVCATCVTLNGPPGYTAVTCLGVLLHSSNSLHLAFCCGLRYMDPCYLGSVHTAALNVISFLSGLVKIRFYVTEQLQFFQETFQPPVEVV